MTAEKHNSRRNSPIEKHIFMARRAAIVSLKEWRDSLDENGLPHPTRPSDEAIRRPRR